MNSQQTKVSSVRNTITWFDFTVFCYLATSTILIWGFSQVSGDIMIYSNRLLYKSVGDGIVYEYEWKLPVECHYDRHLTVDHNFVPVDLSDDSDGSVVGEGAIDPDMHFYSDIAYQEQV